MINKLKQFLGVIDRENPIEFAYLFGSFATGRAHNGSDIDLAIMFRHVYDLDDEALIRGKVIDLGMEHLGKKLDVVSLHNAPPLLKYEVVSKGVLLVDADTRATFESLALREYFDFRYYAEIYNRAMVQTIREDENRW